MDGITALSVLAIASFAVDRFVTGILFLLSFVPGWQRAFPAPTTVNDPDRRIVAEKHYKLVYFTFAAVVGGFVLAYWGNVQLLNAIGFKTTRFIDTVITGLLLMGGAERLSGVIKLPGERRVEKAPAQPIQVTASVVLEQQPAIRPAKAS
jgi:hypothetical protein